MLKLLFSILLILLPCYYIYSSDDIKKPKTEKWSFEGVFGKFDRRSIQRGFQVYKEVCSSCHSLKRIAFRNLEQIGFSAEEVKALAGEYNIEDGPNDEGEMFERPGRPSDYFPSPYRNEKAARAANNNGALPPDLSLIIKARHDGANYVHSLLTGYEAAPPQGFILGENMYYNPYFSGGGQQFSMQPPLKDGLVQYQDETNPSVDQMARDIVNFLQWAAEPEMEERKQMGIKVIAFMVVLTIFFYFTKKKIWKRLK